VIPNSDLFKNSVTVNTAFDTRRLEYDFKIAATEDVERAKDIVSDVIRHSEDVLQDPVADVIVTSFDQGTVTLRARWWSKSRIKDVLLAQDTVLKAIKAALLETGIKLPSSAAPIVINTVSASTDLPKPALPKDMPSEE
jgi:small-conductance mechanosensitive channel